jgi:glutathione S-transferase
MLTVHHLGISQSDRIVWLCEELEIPYELIRYERDPVTRLAPAGYRALYPLGTAPVITDGDLTLGESGAIIEYLIAKHGGRLALCAGQPEFADYLFWFHFANGTLMPRYMAHLIAQRLEGAQVSDSAAWVHERFHQVYGLVEARVGQSEYFAGPEFSAADIIMHFPLTTMRVFSPWDLTPYPHIRAYLKRISARPAYQRAMAKADPGFTPPLS